MTPSYPLVALGLRVEGEVVVECVIEADGRVGQCVVVRRSLHELDTEALRALQQWEFEPATCRGVPVPVVLTTTIHFTQK